MISIDAYRLTIGSFNYFSLQLNLRTICRGLTVGCHVTSTGVTKLLKPARFFCIICFCFNDDSS